VTFSDRVAGVDEMTRNQQEFWNFVGSWFPDADLEGVLDDRQVVRNFISTKNTPKVEAVLQGLREVLDMEPLPVQRVSQEANRHFESESDCRTWLHGVLAVLTEDSSQ
jgi:hypothetical protein